MYTTAAAKIASSVAAPAPMCRDRKPYPHQAVAAMAPVDASSFPAAPPRRSRPGMVPAMAARFSPAIIA